MPSPRPLRIGLLWHAVANGNLGVGALSVGNIALCRAAAARAGLEPRFTVFGPREPGTPYVIGPDIEARPIAGRYMLSPSGYRADLKPLDIMLDIGAGDSFADIYPNKRFAYIMATKALCLWSGTPLVLSPQTIGPFTRQPHKMMAAWACREAAAVFARDPISMQVLGELAPGANAFQVIDVAFALPFDRQPRTADTARIGINVSGLLMSGGYAGGNEYGLSFDYAALTRRLIAALLAMPDIEVHLISHVNSAIPRDDDGRACDQLHAEFPATLRVPDFASPSAAKTYISGLDFLTGARMHATIAAYSAGVAVVPISYSRKFEGLYRGLDYPWLVPAKGMDTDTALAYLLDAIARRGELARDIRRGDAVVAKGLETYTAELATLFAAAAA
jgi:colanic acid/amylovoran biosynthesis protein